MGLVKLEDVPFTFGIAGTSISAVPQELTRLFRECRPKIRLALEGAGGISAVLLLERADVSISKEASAGTCIGVGNFALGPRRDLLDQVPRLYHLAFSGDLRGLRQQLEPLVLDDIVDLLVEEGRMARLRIDRPRPDANTRLTFEVPAGSRNPNFFFSFMLSVEEAASLAGETIEA